MDQQQSTEQAPVRPLSRRKMLRLGCAVALMSPPLVAKAHGQGWPSADLRSICGSPPGSGIDLFVRFYAGKLQEAVGERVIVENRLGESGNLATGFLARARPDGLTIGILQGSISLAAAPALFRTLPFDPVNDFEHVALLAKLQFVLAVPGDSHFETVADLTASLKQRAGEGAYGSTAVTGAVASELYKAQFGLKTVGLTYQDPQAGLADLCAGKIAFMHLSAGFAQEPLRSGKLRALATSAADRTEALRAVPSAREAGILNSNLLSWWSVQAPRGTPTSIVHRLEELFAEIAVADDTKAFLANAGADPMPGGGEQARALLIGETKAWEGYVKLARLRRR